VVGTVTVTLTVHVGGTRLRLVHDGPPPALHDHDLGWTGYLTQLGDAARQTSHPAARP
jgi:hypothetical protein